VAGAIRITATDLAIDTVLWPRLSKVLGQYPDLRWSSAYAWELLQGGLARAARGDRRDPAALTCFSGRMLHRICDTLPV